MTDLKPCPFCGGEARFHPYSAGARLAAAREGMQLVAMVECSSCGAMTSFDDGAIPTEDRARSLWNRRAERTCRVVSAKECGGIGYAPGCSECGWQMADSMWHNYCPNCGARVIGEETDNAD